jgi:hypothetical protein
MKLRLYIISILFSVKAFAQPLFYSVSESDKIRVIQNGKEHFLRAGDLIQVGKKNSWKREINIITTLNPDLKSGDAHLGEITYQEHRKLDRLGPVKSKSRVLTKRIAVINSNGDEVFLEPGDEVLIKGVDGWKRNIEIIRAKNVPIGEAHIGNKTYEDYESSEVFQKNFTGGFSNEVKRFSEFKTLDEIVYNLRKESETPLAEDEFVQGVEVEDVVAGCPKVDQSYKIDRSINFSAKANQLSTIPKGSVVKVIQGDTTCKIQLLKLPKGSVMKFSDYPDMMTTYPSNLSSEFIVEVEDPAKTVALTGGVEFKLADGTSINAIGRRTGRSYTFKDSDTVQVVGKHKNGDYIVKRNNEKWEYRVSSEDLDDMNDNGMLNIDIQSTSQNIIEEDLITKATDKVEPEINCDNYVDNSSMSEDISWQKCRTKRVKTSNGKTLAANNYLEKSIPLSNMDADVILEDGVKKTFSKCISNSLRHGTNRNSNPSCKKDSSGNIIPQRIRQAEYTTKNGKKKFRRWKLLNRAPRACASKKLSTFLADRFVDMSRCLGISAKELFPIINHESHFQPNTISPSYAIGVGQIVSGNYVDFYAKLNGAKKLLKNNSRVINYTRNLHTKEGYANYENTPSKSKPVDRLTAFFLSDMKDKLTSKKKECSGLNKIYNNPLTIPKWARKSQRDMYSYLRQRENQRVCMPKNPDEGFYMSAVYYMYNKKYFGYMMDEKNKSMSPKMNNQQLKDFSMIMARWSYNGGVAGVSGPFERLLQKIKEGTLEEVNSKGRSTGRTLKIKSIAEFSNADFKKYMSYVIKHRYKSKSATRRNEVAHYVGGDNGVGGIDGDLKQTEKGEDGLCGRAL